MTDPLVSAEVAKDILAKDTPASDGVLVQWSAVRSLAATVVAQDEQIERLQNALQNLTDWFDSDEMVADLYRQAILEDGDMPNWDKTTNEDTETNDE